MSLPIVGAPAAAASPVTSFTACWVKPALASLRARVWREKPQQKKFHLVATVPIGPGGGMHYVWPTSLRTDPGEAQYRFQFRIPGHGRSNVVRLWLLF